MISDHPLFQNFDKVERVYEVETVGALNGCHLILLLIYNKSRFAFVLVLCSGDVCDGQGMGRSLVVIY